MADNGKLVVKTSLPSKVLKIAKRWAKKFKDNIDEELWRRRSRAAAIL